MGALSIILLLLAFIGWLLLVRRWIGWMYTFGPSDALLSALYVLHAIAITAWLVFTWIALHESSIRLSTVDGWKVMAWWNQLFVVPGLLLVLIMVPLLFLRKRPAALVSCTENHVDIGCDAPSDGPRDMKHRFALLPRNELFKVSLSEYELRMENLPSSLDGLTLLHLTDTHFNDTPGVDYYEKVFDQISDWTYDMVVLTGDIFDHLEVLDWIPRTLGRLDARLGRYFILGNHDVAHAQQGRKALVDIGWTDVGSKVTTVSDGDAKFLVAGDEYPWFKPRPDLSSAPGGLFTLLLSHTPYEFNWARRNGVDLMLAGHLHGGQIRLPRIGSPNGAPYKDGVFQSRSSVLFVGRGLGQITPIRFGCTPEVTRIRLTSPT